MQVASTNPNSAALMQRVDKPDTHDTRKQDNASQSLFASYAFGPMDLQKLDQKTEKRDDTSTSGVGFGKNPLSASSLSFVTSVQDVGSSDSGTKA
ncbi:hypothetical protein [Magnetospirillum sp. 64-120]|uniref:hypothetical protein n=1 Tax=Magnetospirillum sp. 64-120 TaxID=1895778 RepID=UPI0009298FBE|nr:hypothetical protein [Magnetospirillum sp. 64-120]OJX80917.1 MAG: hypothetical protein BGO92_07420 [Magnetospirillum sp. 64-120]